jgi:CRISPR-associated protein Cas5d
MDRQRNTIEFVVRGREALFTDPITRVGGDKCSYHVPTYEALKGIAKSIYWKPTLVWVIDAVRVLKRIRTHSRSVKPLNMDGIYPSKRDPSVDKQVPFNSLAIYTFLTDVEYQVRAHFEWNSRRPELEADRNEHKHHHLARKALNVGGRQDIFLGTRDCQGYVEPCEFGAGSGDLDDAGELSFGLMFHGFDYPDETGNGALHTRFWSPRMINGVIKFIRPEDCTIRRFVRRMGTKRFDIGTTLTAVDNEPAAEA